MKALAVFLLWSAFGWLLLALGCSARRHWKRREEDERAFTVGTVADYLDDGPRGGR